MGNSDRNISHKGSLISGYSCNFVFFAGGLLATVFFFCVYGMRIVDPEYDDWLFNGFNREDLMQHYMGWLFYRKSEWHFPVTLIDGIYYPSYMPVVYTDSIPLFAVVFKLLSGILPDTFQYFGLYGLLSYFLLGGFSAVTVFGFTKDRIYSVIASLFCSSSMLMLIRVFWHTALSFQWLVVASLYILLFKERQWNIRKSVAYWSLLTFTAIGVQAYFLPMVFICMVTSNIIIILEGDDRRSGVMRLVSCIVASCSVILFFGWILGYFYGSVSNVGVYMGYFSFNYNAFFNNQGLTNLIMELPTIYWGQYEGYAYLGVGVFAVLLSTLFIRLITHRKSSGLLPGKTAVCVAVMSVILMIFAGSNTLSFSDHSVTVPVPEAVYDIWAMFRSSGRMIWPVFYLVVILILSKLRRSCDRRRIVIAISIVCLALQFTENYPFAQRIHSIYYPKQSYECALKDDIWNSVADRYDHIMICSDIKNIYGHDRSIKDNCLELTMFACENDMTINATFFARDVSDSVNSAVEEYLASGRIAADDDTVFIFFEGEPEEDLGLYYYEANGITIGVNRPLE